MSRDPIGVSIITGFQISSVNPITCFSPRNKKMGCPIICDDLIWKLLLKTFYLSSRIGGTAARFNNTSRLKRMTSLKSTKHGLERLCDGKFIIVA